jgi:nucleoside-diphosphate-sugar epimerase
MPRVVIAGCGFLGLATARRFHRAGWDVLGLTHSAESAQALASEPFPVRAADISEPLTSLENERADVVIHCASSGRGGAEAYRRVYLGGARNLLAAFPAARLIFTSSTSVYAQIDGGWVDESSPAEPDRETGQVLLETERLVTDAGGAVARLAGIYGPGRSVLLKKFFHGEAVIEGDGTRWVNQIHRDDAARALYFLAVQNARDVFNVSDDQPLAQRAIYEWLASRFSMPLPPSGPIDPNRKRGWTHKRVANGCLRALGWAPQHRSFFEAIENEPELVTLAR